jgi:hypothetical protein
MDAAARHNAVVSLMLASRKDGFGLGSTRAPRVAIGALADGILTYKRKCMRVKDVAGGGAGHDTRGCACSPACFAPAFGEDLRESKLK